MPETVGRPADRRIAEKCTTARRGRIRRPTAHPQPRDVAMPAALPFRTPSSRRTGTLAVPRRPRRPVIEPAVRATCERALEHELHSCLIAIAPRPLSQAYRNTLARRTRAAGKLPTRVALAIVERTPLDRIRAEMHAAVDRALDTCAAALLAPEMGRVVGHIRPALAVVRADAMRSTRRSA